MNPIPTTLSLFTLAVLTSILLPAIAAAEEWKFVEQRDGVVIYERSAEHLGQYALRGVVEADVPIDKVVSILVDPEERPHWVYRVADQQILESEDDSGEIWSERYWTRLDMPFPVSDRDYVLMSLYEFHPDDKKVTASVQSIEDPRQPKAGGCCVRAESSAQYTVTALPGQERTRIEVIVESDLKGRVSDGLIRRVGPDWPVHTLKNLLTRALSNGVKGDLRVKDWHQ